MTDPRLHGIYAILDAQAYGDTLYAGAQDLIAGGIRLFQYRAKLGVDPDVVRALYTLTQASGALLVVNDDYDAASLADGIHIGQDDLDDEALTHFRMKMPAAIIGVSAHTPAQIAAAPYASYFGIGPLRATTSKSVARPPLGLAGIAELAQHTQRPVCAIGGINLDDILEIAGTHIAMAACIGAFAVAADRRAVASTYVDRWRRANGRA